MQERHHIPVLLEPVLEVLAPEPGEVVVDATLGLGGHAVELARRIGAGGHLIGLDVDDANLEAARGRIAALGDGAPRVDLVRANFRELGLQLHALGVTRVDVLLADLGFASAQMDDATRGFSFAQDGPLDMRLDERLPETAADLVNGLPERELADLIYEFGEERLSRRIAQKIDEIRRVHPIQSTGELADVVRRAYPGKMRHQSRMDPATRTFMALRIAVNDELGALSDLLDQLPDWLGQVGQGGRVGIISFHSLEDRPVKQRFVEWEKQDRGKRLNRKVIQADDSEQQRNPRSRSAKLRAFAFTDTDVLGSVMEAQHDQRNKSRFASRVRDHSPDRDRGQ